jgi:hypothetical protein
MSSTFLLLKYLDISLVDVQLYRVDYFCLVSFLEASPALEIFVLRVSYSLCYLSEPLKICLGTLSIRHVNYNTGGSYLSNSALFNTSWQAVLFIKHLSVQSRSIFDATRYLQ